MKRNVGNVLPPIQENRKFDPVNMNMMMTKMNMQLM